MSYKFEGLEVADVVLLGKALGKLTIDEAMTLHVKLQTQIIAQERRWNEEAVAARLAREDALRSEGAAAASAAVAVAVEAAPSNPESKTAESGS